jgi:hypothetical protein
LLEPCSCFSRFSIIYTIVFAPVSSSSVSFVLVVQNCSSIVAQMHVSFSGAAIAAGGGSCLLSTSKQPTNNTRQYGISFGRFQVVAMMGIIDWFVERREMTKSVTGIRSPETIDGIVKIAKGK